MGLNDKQRDCAHARMALAAEVLRLHEVTGFGITDAVQFVVRQVESGQLSETLAYLVPVANARANNQRGISHDARLSRGSELRGIHGAMLRIKGPQLTDRGVQRRGHERSSPKLVPNTPGWNGQRCIGQ